MYIVLGVSVKLVDEFTRLKEEASSLIRDRGAVSAQELVDWARREGIGELTLYLIVEELLESGDFRGEGPQFTIEPSINLEIPSRIVYAKKEAKHAKQPPPKKPARQRQRAPPSQSLLRFLQGEEDNAKPASEPSKPSSKPPETPPPQAEEQKSGTSLAPDLEDLLGDPDFAKAVKYLGRYWSVGRLRFLSDMRSEEVSVQKAEKILLELRRRGLVELTENNVINAGKVIRDLYVQKHSKTSLYDVFA
ncbi:MAG: hypothetical protein ABWK01_07855 [Infirmifilum sp.]